MLVTFLVLSVLLFAYIVVFFVWLGRETTADKYFSLPKAQRARFKSKVRRFGFFPRLAMQVLSKLTKKKSVPLIFYQGISGPRTLFTLDSIKFAKSYRATNDDIFVVTHMKAGTTWMQQIVFEILEKGKGDLSDDGYKHIYAMSPWLEANPHGAVPFDRAPKVGASGKRIIKTHAPVEWITHNDMGKYIYVARHPVSVFSSGYEYYKYLAGPFLPDQKAYLEWFCSDEMFYTPWPEHLKRWWNLSREKSNILFLHYEDIQNGPREVIMKIATFLGEQLNDEDLSRIEEKVSISFMKKHEDCFEMAPPNIFSVCEDEGRSINRARSESNSGLDEQSKQKIIEFCTERLKDCDYPIQEHYSDFPSR